MTALTLSVRNLGRQRRRALLTALTFAGATFIFAVLVSIPASIDQILTQTSRSLRVLSYNADGRYLGIPVRYCSEIEQMAGVVGCTPLVYFPATYQKQAEIIRAYGMAADKLGVVFPDYGIAREVLDRFAHDRIGALAGKLLMRNHRWKIGDAITLRGDSNRLDLRFILVGEVPSDYYPNFFVFHRDYLREAEKAIDISEAAHPAALLATRVDSAGDIARVIQEIDGAFHNSDFETATMTESEAAAGLMSTIGDVRAIVYSVFAVILLTVFLIAGNSMAMLARERLRDAAVLRALGFGAPYVALVLLGECALIGIAGGVLGSTLALWEFGPGTTLAAVLENAGYLTITSGAAAASLATAVALSILSGLLPVLGALRVTPADAFRRTL